MPSRPRSISSGAIAAGVVDVVLAEAQVLAGRVLTDVEVQRLRGLVEQLRLIEERRASAQLDKLGDTARLPRAHRAAHARRRRDA